MSWPAFASSDFLAHTPGSGISQAFLLEPRSKSRVSRALPKVLFLRAALTPVYSCGSVSSNVKQECLFFIRLGESSYPYRSVWCYPLKEEQSFSDQFLAGSAVKLSLSQKGAEGRNRKPQGLSLLRTSGVFRGPVTFHHILRTIHTSARR